MYNTYIVAQIHYMYSTCEWSSIIINVRAFHDQTMVNGNTVSYITCTLVTTHGPTVQGHTSVVGKASDT